MPHLDWYKTSAWPVLARNTAMRSEEIKVLRWRQVDLTNRTIIVGKSKTDAGPGRAIPLNQSATALRTYWRGQSMDVAPENHVFPTCELIDKNGGSVRTRTADLLRVKQAL